MAPERPTKYPWDLPLPRVPILRPTWTRGQDGETATMISMPQIVPSHNLELAKDRLVPSKRSFFKASDAVEAQDAALADQTTGYDHDLLHHHFNDSKKRRDSIQDDHSTSAESIAGTASLVSSPRLPTKAKPQIPAVVLTTEPTPPSDESAAPIPKELEIDGNAGFDPHQTEDTNTPQRLTYSYKGKRYEVQGNEPKEWLKDVRVVAPMPRQTSPSRRRSRSSITPSSTRSGTTQRTRQSRRESSDVPEDNGRRRSGRIR